MPLIKNIAPGDRGAYVKACDTEPVMVPPGKTIEAVDWPEADFEVLKGEAPASAPAVAGEEAAAELEIEAPTDQEIADAVAALDPYNDDHWTAKSQPVVDIISEALAFRVSRADIERAAPGVVRPPIGD